MVEKQSKNNNTSGSRIDRERVDRDAFYFLTAVVIIIMTVVFFKTEILRLVLSSSP